MDKSIRGFFYERNLFKRKLKYDPICYGNPDALKFAIDY